MPEGTTFFCGPPGAGKSTLAGYVALRLNRRLRSIDDFVPRGQRLSDAQIDEALMDLICATRHQDIVELCYHDYMGLLRKLLIPEFSACDKVVVIASLEVCKARNDTRSSPVPVPYVERAWRSTNSLWEWCNSYQSNKSILIDTTKASVSDSVSAALQYFEYSELREI
ncbi:MAG: ATP-binding protein [Planctomycetaceae bacterium]|nr:ATP-binding protein [Planctomycetaceae bacterium]